MTFIDWSCLVYIRLWDGTLQRQWMSYHVSPSGLGFRRSHEQGVPCPQHGCLTYPIPSYQDDILYPVNQFYISKLQYRVIYVGLCFAQWTLKRLGLATSQPFSCLVNQSVLWVVGQSAGWVRIFCLQYHFLAFFCMIMWNIRGNIMPFQWVFWTHIGW